MPKGEVVGKLMIAGLFLVPILIIAVAPTVISNNEKAAQADQHSASDQSSDVLAVGDQGVLNSGASEVALAPSEATEKQMNDAAAAKDQTRYFNASSGALFVKSGTRAQVIGYGSGMLGDNPCHVRVVDGPNAQRDGWIPREWIKK